MHNFIGKYSYFLLLISPGLQNGTFVVCSAGLYMADALPAAQPTVSGIATSGPNYSKIKLTTRPYVSTLK